MPTLYGYLHSWSHEKAEAPDVSDFVAALEQSLISRPEFGPCNAQILPSIGNWDPYLYRSPRPLMGEEEGSMFKDGYTYPFYVYINKLTGNVVIGSYRYRITNEIIEFINYYLKVKLVRNSINIQKITDFVMAGQLLHRNKRVFVSQLTLDVHDFGSKLQSMTLYGFDVSDSGFFQRIQKIRFTAKQIGLMIPGASIETTRLQHGGGIQFYSERLRDLEKILGVVRAIDCFSPNI